jgi:5-methyltetrahydrofolate--homocysteine methyltransferase
MNRKYTNRQYLDLLKKKIVVFDGAMGTNLQVQNLTAEHFGGERTNGCNDFLVISYPKAVENVHRAFLEAGVDVIETCTFRANRLTMKEYGLQDRIGEINQTAASWLEDLRMNTVKPARKDWWPVLWAQPENYLP